MGGDAISIDKCVFVKDAFWVPTPQFNGYLLLAQCADFDAMQAYAQGKGGNFPVFTYILANGNKESTRKALSNQYKKGSVWTTWLNYKTGGDTKWMWQIVYQNMRAKPEDYAKPGGVIQRIPVSGPQDKYHTTVKKLISGNW